MGDSYFYMTSEFGCVCVCFHMQVLRWEWGTLGNMSHVDLTASEQV